MSVRNPNGGEVVRSCERIGGRRESHSDGGFVTRPDLDHRWRLKNKVNFPGAASVEVDSECRWRVTFVFDDNTGCDGFTDGKVDRLTGRRKRCVHVFTDADGNDKTRDVYV